MPKANLDKLSSRTCRADADGDVQISFGPISWVMIGEIFPVSVRGQAIAICTLTNFATNFVVSFIHVRLSEALQPYIARVDNSSDSILQAVCSHQAHCRPICAV